MEPKASLPPTPPLPAGAGASMDDTTMPGEGAAHAATKPHGGPETADFIVQKSRSAADRLGGAAPPQIPGYAIDAELGRGGMGVVYRARDLELNRPVALKMILAGDFASEEQRLRFLIEAETLARVQHPNIVQVHDIGACGGRPYFALEFVDGGTLADRCRSRKTAPREAARLAETLARAVHAAHLQGIVHRDLKPANVLLTQDGAPKISDFGLAKRLQDDAHLTATGQALGTPAYMAPEQAAGRTKEIGPATDIHALGAILYELLAGQPAFRAASLPGLYEKIRNGAPLPLRKLAPAVPRDLEVIVLKCLEKAPAQRYASAEALADDLRRFLELRPILARPVGAVERSVKWARRNPAIAALAGSLLAVLLGALAGMTGLYFRAEEKREAAEKAEAERKRERDAALAAQRAAERSDDAAKRINDFLFDDVLSAPQSGSLVNRGLGRNVTLREALDVAEPRIALSFKGRPELEASVRVSFAETYVDLGEFGKAEKQIRLAAVLTQGQTLATLKRPATFLRSVAKWSGKTEQPASEVAALEQLCRMWPLDAKSSPPHEFLDQVTLVRAYAAANQLDDAERLLASLKAFLPSAAFYAGPLDFSWMELRQAEAMLQERRGRPEAALRLHKENEESNVTVPTGDPLRHEWRRHEAALRLSIGEVPMALGLLRESFAATEEILGARHPDRLQLQLWLCWSLLLNGQGGEAAPLLADLRKALDEAGVRMPLLRARVAFLEAALALRSAPGSVHRLSALTTAAILLATPGACLTDARLVVLTLLGMGQGASARRLPASVESRS